jgi:hypothetical protein
MPRPLLAGPGLQATTVPTKAASFPSDALPVSADTIDFCARLNRNAGSLSYHAAPP